MRKVHDLPILFLVFATISCKPSAADRAALLPELPANLLASLDTATLATRIPTSVPEPIPDTMGVALAPCCAIRVDRTLQVTYPYVQCKPLRDWTTVDLDNMTILERSDNEGAQPERGAQGAENQPAGQAVAYYRLPTREAVSRRSAWDQIICMTRTGPWAASLTESRACNNYTPQYSLIITPDNMPLTFNWVGDISAHPADIGLVSCRRTGEVRTPCGALSTCECHSSACPAGDPCECGIEEVW